MNRKFPLFILLAFIALSMMVVPIRVSGQTELMGVRIPSGQMDNRISTNVQGEILIDYGSFLWSVMAPEDLRYLDREGIQYQTIENPYMLTLGGQSFDPLVSIPDFDTVWDTKSLESGQGLHLVQFLGPTKDEWLDALDVDGLEVLQYIHPFTYVVWGEVSDSLDGGLPACLCRATPEPSFEQRSNSYSCHDLPGIWLGRHNLSIGKIGR